MERKCPRGRLFEKCSNPSQIPGDISLGISLGASRVAPGLFGSGPNSSKERLGCAFGCQKQLFLAWEVMRIGVKSSKICVFLGPVLLWGVLMSAKVPKTCLDTPPAASFLCAFPRSPREAAFWTRRKQKTLDFHNPRGSKSMLSPRRRAGFLKIACFPLDPFPT